MSDGGSKSTALVEASTGQLATQGTTVLRGGATLSAMRCDHLDAIAFGQISIQAVTVIGFVADQFGRDEDTSPLPARPS